MEGVSGNKVFTCDEVMNSCTELANFLQTYDKDILSEITKEFIFTSINIMKMRAKYRTSKEEWMSEQLKINSVNKDVIEFIANFRFLQGPDVSDALVTIFEFGYCLHFALILKSIFNHGTLCIISKDYHVVWQDDNGILYDITGVVNTNKPLIKFCLDDTIAKNFTHIPSEDRDKSIVDEAYLTLLEKDYEVSFDRSDFVQMMSKVLSKLEE